MRLMKRSGQENKREERRRGESGGLDFAGEWASARARPVPRGRGWRHVGVCNSVAVIGI